MKGVVVTEASLKKINLPINPYYYFIQRLPKHLLKQKLPYIHLIQSINITKHNLMQFSESPILFQKQGIQPISSGELGNLPGQNLMNTKYMEIKLNIIRRKGLYRVETYTSEITSNFELN
ncbi:hypothetical protein NSTC731_05133 [Nostoc sp. DSM 114167]|jgi:hypothetical protein